MNELNLSKKIQITNKMVLYDMRLLGKIYENNVSRVRIPIYFSICMVDGCVLV